MNEVITTAAPYLDMSRDDLIDGIKKAHSKAFSKGQEMKIHMARAGHMLIELKRQLPHGRFMNEAESSTRLPQRTINRYMEMARGVIPHRTVKVGERDTPKDRMITLIRDTEYLLDDTSPNIDTVSTLPENSPSSRPAASEVIDAELIEPAPAIIEDNHQDDEQPVVDTPPPAISVDSPHLFLSIVHQLPELSQGELTELVRIIQTRWLR